MKQILTYISLWFAFAKNSFIRQLEFKINLIGRFVTELIWLAGQLLFFKAVFLQVPAFAGWTESEIYFFVGSLYLVDGAFMLLLSENQRHFGELVRNGLFDFYLLRPMSAFFMACFRHLNLAGLINLSGGIAVSLWALTRPDLSLTPTQIAVWLVYLGVGFGLLVCLLMGICCLAFWVTQTANLNWLFFELYRLGWRPENLYPLWMRRFLWAVFPAAFLVSIPVQLSLSKLSGAWWIYPWVWLFVAVTLLRQMWKRGVARYEGALS